MTDALHPVASLASFRVEHRQPQVRCAALFGRGATHHLRAILDCLQEAGRQQCMHGAAHAQHMLSRR